jgi:hypothetical protein
MNELRVKMFGSNLLLVATLSIIYTAQAFVPCADPSHSAGGFLGASHQCAALVQSQCHRPGNALIGLTNTWRKGLHVRENCAQIPKFTAIATFLGPNGSYDEPHLHQHTAIFVRCEAAGIRVWDQWVGQPIGSRVIHWNAGSSPQYTGVNFWTIA